MKQILFLLLFCLCAFFAGAQKVDYKIPFDYSKVSPTRTPSAIKSAFWYNTETGVLWNYDKTAGAWVEYLSKNYGEMGISNDTLSLSFAATTADTLQGMTGGSLSGFLVSADGGNLVYIGAHTKTFLAKYSASFTFAEAVPVWAYLQVSGSAKLLSRTRALPATAGNTVNVAGQTIVTLTPGQTVSLFFVPTTHSGTDALTVYEANVTLTEIE